MFKNTIILFSLVIFCACGESGGGGTAACDADSCGHCPSAQTGLKICSFVASPTINESITLINYTTIDIDLNGYSLWDQNAKGNGAGEEIIGSTTITADGGTYSISNLPFVINDSGETIYLVDPSDQTVDTKSN